MVTYAFTDSNGAPLWVSGLRQVFEVPDGTPIPDGAVEWVEPQTPPPVPYEVSRRQFFLAVYQVFGLTRAQLRAMMPNEAALIDFDEAAQFKRSYPVLVQLAGQMDPPVTSEQLDDLFRLAATFE